MKRCLKVAALLVAIATANAQDLTFTGRKVTVTKPEVSADGFYPKGPASICLEGSVRQCYTMPKDFGRSPEADLVQLEKNTTALLFLSGKRRC